MPNRFVTLLADTATEDTRPVARILCPHCMYTQTVMAEGGCSTEACEDCGSPSESE